MAMESPHLTVVHCSAIQSMFEKEITAIGAVVNRKTSNPPVPLPPKRRGPPVSAAVPFRAEFPPSSAPAVSWVKGGAPFILGFD